MPLANGQTFAGYTILQLLGSGGMGDVYLAQHPELPRNDAVKLLGEDVSADDDYRSRFAREAELAGALRHPNIVAVHDRGEADGQLWISMDFIEGSDAAHQLAAESPSGLPAERVEKIVSAVADALDHAHDQGLLHRDVTPAKIIISAEGQRILLAGFGIPRSRHVFVVATPQYSAPEQLMSDDSDGRADQYALAATAYHLLTGSPLFTDSDQTAIIGHQLTTAPPKLADTRPELASLDPVFAIALAKNPDERYPTCAAFAQAFAAALPGAGAGGDGEPPADAAAAGESPSVPEGESAGPDADPAAAEAPVDAEGAALLLPPEGKGRGIRWLGRAAALTLVLVITVALVAAFVVTKGFIRVDGRPLIGVRAVAGHGVRAEPRLGEPVKWSACRISPGANVPGGSQCGRLAVPVDYDHPDAGVAALQLIRFPATGNRIGSLVINPGGPGESGVEAALSVVKSLPKQVRERFDLVGFDPRGVGLSRPAIWCNSDAENDRLRTEPGVDYSPAGVAHMEDETKQFVARCVDKMGKNFLENAGTANVAKDLDAIRLALGDEKLTYLGYSYGTRIGSAYAEAYPKNVRAMILDGAVDPNADQVEADLRQAKGFQDAFNDYAADCAKDPNCPLGTDPAKAVDVYHSLVDPLVDPNNLMVGRPAKTKDPRGLSYSDAIIGTIMALYSPNLWHHLTDGLSELADHHGDTLLALADMYMRRDPSGHYNNASDARVAINCVDELPITDRAKVVDEDRRSREVAPFMSYGQFTGNAPLGTCAFWPVPPTSKPHEVTAPGLAPTVVVSTTHDPATPYKAGVDLAEQLKGSLLTFEGTQHTVVFEGNSCIDDYATAYLVDGTTPPSGAKC